MHSRRLCPDGVSDAHLGHPPSSQFLIPRGVPLYPVEIILLSLTMIAATCLLEQLLLVAMTSAIAIKYWSQSGRIFFDFVCFFFTFLLLIIFLVRIY